MKTKFEQLIWRARLRRIAEGSYWDEGQDPDGPDPLDLKRYRPGSQTLNDLLYIIKPVAAEMRRVFDGFESELQRKDLDLVDMMQVTDDSLLALEKQMAQLRGLMYQNQTAVQTDWTQGLYGPMQARRR